MKTFFKFFFGAIAIAGLAAGFGWVVMWLWNQLVPGLFNGPILNWSQAVGILILARLLTGGFGRGGGWKRHCHHCGHGGWKNHKQGYWKNRWQQKMENMTPEQRERYANKMKHWCGDWSEENQKPQAPTETTNESQA